MAKKSPSKAAATPTPAATMPATDAAPVAPAAKTVKPRATSVPRAKAAKAIANAEPSLAPVSVGPMVADARVTVTDQMIAERAFYKWCNGEPGDHYAHWCEAERELRGNT